MIRDSDFYKLWDAVVRLQRSCDKVTDNLTESVDDLGDPPSSMKDCEIAQQIEVAIRSRCPDEGA